MNIYTLKLGALETNCYIIADEATREAIIIDAPDHPEKIVDFLKGHDLKPVKIILTHGHFDHILALGKLKEMLNIPAFIHKNGEAFLTDCLLNLTHYVNIEFTPPKVDGFLNDGDIITFGDTKIKVIHTPGHTSDCICLSFDDILISGDTLFYRSVGRVDHPTGNMREEINSIKEKLFVLDDNTKVYPGHGPSTTIGEERRENPYLIF